MYTTITNYIEIDREQRSVRKDGQAVHLTGLEYGLLAYLSAHPNRICTRQMLLDHVWGDRFQYDTGTIDVHLNALRRKLGWTNKEPIETIRGIGFIFHIEQKVTHYTIDLQAFLTDWLRSRETDILAKGLAAQLHLTPFVNEITIEPNALWQMLDSVLTALLPSAQPGVLQLSSKLTMQHFILSLDLNGTINELRIPIYSDFDAS
ncbi:MAG: winged helix-turn-helix transcriptional regulator [Paludibacteraceae bacterium]|nr:winged helix-turn-helix transcriptional regulator [Paludibacteraceae bacterium]MBR4705249.1 winged helix-turn-helix transcriptional regulator [Paludibacteraceae bacterium]